jgi:putative transposase
MIFKGDIFILGGTRQRLLQTDTVNDVAWVISLEDEHPFPEKTPWSAISGLEPVNQSHTGIPDRRISPAAIRARDKATAAVWPLLAHGEALFDEVQRFSLIKRHTEVAGVSAPSLYKWLRMYWKNGMCENALLPNFAQCGAALREVTGGRGTKSKSGVATYQVTQEDAKRFDELLTTHYLADERVTLSQTYQRLLERHYSYLDGNGNAYLNLPGMCPSYRQFQHYLNTHYTREARLRSRHGNKEFERKHRGILGTVSDDCLGVGHYYECDATIADVYLVAQDDPQSIIGKPTLYFIVDRESRLIVGVYIGLENASWTCAKEAILFISEDKEQICKRYGVTYNPDDWPAHTVFPLSILADLGEWNSRGGEQFGNNLSVKVAFVPSQRADWKPVVETQFKQMRVTLQDGVPGVDPPENAMRRQGKHYEIDACLTLHGFTKLVLEHVIKHNNTPRKDYPLSMADLRNEFLATPIAIWNRGIVERSGMLTRYPFEHVWMQLLPRGVASVTEHGIEFEDCLYTSEEAINKQWFVNARARRFQVEVAFERRLVDSIWVLDTLGKAPPMLCNLSSRSNIHRGRSFAEVKVYQDRLRKLSPTIDHARRQATSNFHTATAPIVKTSLATLTDEPKMKSRSARRADTKDARANELAIERSNKASLKTRTAVQGSPAPSTAAVLDFRSAKKQMEAARQPAPTSNPVHAADAQRPVTGTSMAERLRAARQALKGQA